LLAVKSKTLNLLFSNKCSVIVYIASHVNPCFYNDSFSNDLLDYNILAKCIAVSYPIDVYTGLSTFKTVKVLLFQFKTLLIPIIPSWLISLSAKFNSCKFLLLNKKSMMVIEPSVFILLPAKFKYVKLPLFFKVSAIYFPPSVSILLPYKFKDSILIV